jgi:ATP-binding cassette subfamily F protein 3
VGPNGSGKSTLLRCLVGDRRPEGGEVRIPESIRVSHYRQDLSQVPIDRSVYDIIADRRPQWARGPVQGHLGRFGFSGDSVLRSAGSLSGGERARMALALMMLENANLLVFDEPTNHLDVESIEALEDAIEDFDGTVLLVSHDRALLRALVSRVWVLHDRRITDFPGTFGEWEVASEERMHAARVTAAEEEASRRVRERKQTRAQPARAPASAGRAARRELDEAEALVAAAEQRVAAITGRLEDPALYTSDGGTAEAVRLGRELEEAKGALEDAFIRWERASAAADAAG